MHITLKTLLQGKGNKYRGKVSLCLGLTYKELAHDTFLGFDGAIKIANQSKKSNLVALIKQLNRKGIEKKTGGASPKGNIVAASH